MQGVNIIKWLSRDKKVDEIFKQGYEEYNKQRTFGRKIKYKDWKRRFLVWILFYLSEVESLLLFIQKLNDEVTQRRKLGFKKEILRYRELSEMERAHYAKAHWDLECNAPGIGWIEIANNAYRTDHDLKGHMGYSGKDLHINIDGKNVIPHMYEPSIGLDRVLLCIMLLSYKEDDRRWLSLPRQLAPVEVGVLPLVKRDGLDVKAKEITSSLAKDFRVFYDDKGSIGRRYRRLDEIGTPLCVTIDYQTLEDGSVTLRDRDTMKQVRVKIRDLHNSISKFLEGERLEMLAS